MTTVYDTCGHYLQMPDTGVGGAEGIQRHKEPKRDGKRGRN